MTRREVLKQLVAAMALATVKVSGADAAAGVFKIKTEHTSLRYYKLVEAYLTCTHGSREPNVLLLPPTAYAELYDLIMSSTKDRVVYYKELPNGDVGIGFHGAIVRPYSQVQLGHVWVVNTDEADPRFSGDFDMTGPNSERAGDLDLDKEYE